MEINQFENASYITTTNLTNTAGTGVGFGVEPSINTGLRPTNTGISDLSKLGSNSLTSHPLDHGTIIFRPVEARLHSHKGQKDLYCKVKLGWHSRKTQMAHFGDHPMWGDAISLKFKGEKSAKIKIKEKQKMGLSETVGKAYIHLGHVVTLGRAGDWIPLMKNDQSVGEIHVAMQFEPSAEHTMV